FSSLSTDAARGATQLGGAGRAGYHQGQYGQAGFAGQPGYDQPGFGTQQPYLGADADTRPMTIDDIVTKTSMTLGLLAVVGVIAFYLSANFGLTLPLLLVGGIGGLIVVLVA